MDRKRKFIPAVLRFSEASLAGLQAFLDASYDMNPNLNPRRDSQGSDDANHPEVIQGHEAANEDRPGVLGDEERIPRKKQVTMILPREDHMAVITMSVNPETYEQPFNEYAHDMIEAVEELLKDSDDVEEEEFPGEWEEA